MITKTNQTIHTHSRRYTRSFDISDVEKLPQFLGYMQSAVDDGLTAIPTVFEYPWKPNLLRYLKQDGRCFAIYLAYLFNTIVDNEPGRSLRVYIAFN